MSELTLTTPHEHSLLGLVRAALDAQERVLLTGIFRTQERLRAFEEKYQMSTHEFSARFADDELEESLDFVE